MVTEDLTLGAGHTVQYNRALEAGLTLLANVAPVNLT